MERVASEYGSAVVIHHVRRTHMHAARHTPHTCQKSCRGRGRTERVEEERRGGNKQGKGEFMERGGGDQGGGFFLREGGIIRENV